MAPLVAQLGIHRIWLQRPPISSAGCVFPTPAARRKSASFLARDAVSSIVWQVFMCTPTESSARLYAIVDVDICQARGMAVVEFALAVCASRPRCIQLRAKHSTARDTLSLLRAIIPIARANGVLTFANDRPDLALLANADGVHVGQDDLPVAQVREVAPALRVGIRLTT